MEPKMGTSKRSQTFPLNVLIEYACSAYRVNSGYIKEQEYLYSSENTVTGARYPNKLLINIAVGYVKWGNESKPGLVPPTLKVVDEDKILAVKVLENLKKQLLFSAIKGDNDFLTQVNSILNTDLIPASNIGFIACLPMVYYRNKKESEIKKQLKDCENTFVADVGSSLSNLSVDIFEVTRSKNFDAWNVSAIMSNKLVSWFSKVELPIGNYYIKKAKVKEHREHWKYKKIETRLNYVKG